MKLFNVGATRPAIDVARASAANDLVQRTLAQHGLVSPIGQGEQTDRATLPSLDRMLAQFSGPSMRADSQPIAVPDGAAFKDDSCNPGPRWWWCCMAVRRRPKILQSGRA